MKLRTRLLASSLASLAAIGLAGCSPKADDAGFGTDTDGLPDCAGDHAPVFVGDVKVEDGGTQSFSGTSKRALKVSVQATDEDGDLFQYRVQLWHDTTTDGSFRQTKPQVDIPVKLGDPNIASDTGESDPCRFKKATVGAYVPLGEDAVPMGELVEFGLVVMDAKGNASNGGTPTIVTFDTPAE